MPMTLDDLMGSINEILAHTNDEVGLENANKNPDLISTQRDLISGEVSKYITDTYLLPERLRVAHEKGKLHFHDRDYFMSKGMINCSLVNIEDMLKNGTVMNGKLIETPKGFHVATTVVSQIIATVASGQYGGQSIDIRHLSPYLRVSKAKFEEHYRSEFEDETGLANKEAMIQRLVEKAVQKEVASAVQTLQYQINTLFSTNGQSPFVSLFMYLDKDDEYFEETYMIIEEILHQRIKGIKNKDGVYVTPAFPKLLYVLTEDNAIRGSKYFSLTQLAARCTAKRMYPDYISEKIMKETYEGNVFSPMGCRSFLSPWKDEHGKYKFSGRFNQGVVTINLPQLGIRNRGNEEAFWKEYDEVLDLAREGLMLRYNMLKGATSDVAPVLFQYGGIARLKPGEKIDKLLEDGYSTLACGYIGLYELSILMTGKSNTTPEGKAFTMRVLDHMVTKVSEWKAETGLGFSVYSTPKQLGA